MFSIGCDIESINRIETVNKDHRLAKRILTSNEYERYSRFNVKRQIEFLAGRFCAKEAIIKACEDEITMKEIEIKNNVFHYKNTQFKVSISHTQNMAMAMVIAYEMA